jgi:hypothetical protein
MASACSCGHDSGAHGQLVGGQTGFFMGFANRCLLGSLVAVAGTAGQTPCAALVAPRCAVLQQYRGGTVRTRRAQQ